MATGENASPARARSTRGGKILERKGVISGGDSGDFTEECKSFLQVGKNIFGGKLEMTPPLAKTFAPPNLL
jgi:hypothetical protein